MPFFSCAVWTLCKLYELRLTRPCSSFGCTSLGYVWVMATELYSGSELWAEAISRAAVIIIRLRYGCWWWWGGADEKGKLRGVRIGGDAKFIGGGEPIYSGLAGIPAPHSASQSDRISHHKPFPSQSPLRLSFSTQSRVFVWKADWEELFPEIKKFTSQYMQTLHADCKSFENDDLRYEWHR